MARETEVKVDKAWEAIKQLQFQMAQVMTAIMALTEANDQATVEGDDIHPKVKNGKLRK